MLERSSTGSAFLFSLAVAVAATGCSGSSSPDPSAAQPIQAAPAPQPTPTPPAAPPTPPTPVPPAAADVNLASLDLSIGDLDQIFQPSQTKYTATAVYRENAVEIAMTPSDPNAVIRVNGETVASSGSQALDLAEGENPIDIDVANGPTKRTYTLEVTREPGSTFAQTAYIKSSNTGADDVFGTVLALSGDTLVVGAPFEDGSARGVNGNADDASADSGAAYVFVRDAAGTWSQQAYLKASNTDVRDNFGYSVAISGDTIAIGAPQEASDAVGIDGEQSSNTAAFAGAVYVFVRDSSGQWTQEAYVKASNTVASGGFGTTVALDADTLAVGAKGMPVLTGSVYTFTRDSDGSWSQEAILMASDAAPDFGFGQNLALRGDLLAVGSPWHGGLFSRRGAVYMFERQGNAWTESAKLKGSNTGNSDLFGSSVALAEDLLAVGATGEASSAVGIDGNQANNSASDSGAVYVFARGAAGDWSQEAYVKASNTDASDSFGYAVALSGDWLAVTAENEGGSATGVNGTQSDNGRPGSGAAYLFVRDTAGEWSAALYIKAQNADANDRFGRSAAALSSSMLVVAAPFEDSNATGVNGNAGNNGASSSGALYVFE